VTCKTEDKIPFIVNHSTKWRRIIRFTPGTLDLRTKNAWYPLATNAGLGAVEEKKHKQVLSTIVLMLDVITS
jgi:hypothetical protein